MSAAMSAVVAARTVAPVAAVAPAGGVACDVFAGEVYDEQTARLARMIDPRFLAECGATSGPTPGSTRPVAGRSPRRSW